MEKKKVIKIGTSILRWSIAVVGIFWVLHQISWRDQVLAILPGQTIPTRVNLADRSATDSDKIYKVIDPVSGSTLALPRALIVNEPDKAKMRVLVHGKPEFLLGVDLSEDLKEVHGLLVSESLTGPGVQIKPGDAPDYRITVPHPLVQQGVIRMAEEANWLFLLAAIIVIPLTFTITSYRWHELMRALDIQVALSRTFVLNMVGNFYNTFMPGSTGGDVLKAYYVAKQTHHRTRAVMSVIVDRVIGLLALIILGGTMAATQWHIPMCRRVAIASWLIIAITALGLVVFYVPLLRKITGFNFLVSRMPMQKQVHNAMDTMHILGRRPYLAAGALLISLPVHCVVVVSALLAGKAFGLHLAPAYYFMAIPVIVLAGAIPISPQGAGVMEYFAIKLLEPQGVTVAQAFAITMSIRLVQILWNVSGGFFVLRGGFHAPSQTEQKEVEAEDEGEPPAAAGTPAQVLAP
jgi:uncharacterized protein (TIRG00374 family)